MDFRRYVVDYCRAVANVVLGEPTAVNLVTVVDDRFAWLQGREVDVLFAGDAHMLENDIREVSETEGMVSNIATSCVFRRACECGSFFPTAFAHKPTTGAFFWFGGAYYRSQVVYAGLPDLMLCASRGKRHGECWLPRQIIAAAASMRWRQQPAGYRSTAQTAATAASPRFGGSSDGGSPHHRTQQ